MAFLFKALQMKLDRFANKLQHLVPTLSDDDAPRKVRYISVPVRGTFFDNDGIFQ